MDVHVRAASNNRFRDFRRRPKLGTMTRPIDNQNYELKHSPEPHYARV
jgi:hypothetical protein